MLSKASAGGKSSTLRFAAGSVLRPPHALSRGPHAACTHLHRSASCKRTISVGAESGHGDSNRSEEEAGSASRADTGEVAGTGGGFGNKGGAGQSGGGDGSFPIPPGGPAGNEGPQAYPKWLQVWIWATVAVYLVARTKWRLDKWQLRREQEQEATLQARQDQEWQRFVGEYVGSTLSSANQQGTQHK